MVNCLENLQCLPQNPLDVLNIFDVWFGAGMSLLAMGLILGTITLGIYLRTRSLPMLTVLGIYELAAFGVIITNKYFVSQYHTLETVTIIGGAVAASMLVLRLVKE